MQNIQTLLVVVVIALTILLIIVGVQVVFIIMDMRRALKRLNSILDDAILGGGLISPGRLTGIVEMFKKRKTKKIKSHGANDEFQD